VRGSALKALEEHLHRPERARIPCIKELMDTIDSYFPDPQRDVEPNPS
jgi:elongation factor Tu